MLVTINAGGRTLVALDREPLTIAVSVDAVGAYFLPFARAFRTPMFAVLGYVMTPLGLVGLVLGLDGRSRRCRHSSGAGSSGHAGHHRDRRPPAFPWLYPAAGSCQ